MVFNHLQSAKSKVKKFTKLNVNKLSRIFDFRRLCAVCQMNSKIKYFLRGLCHESKHDRVFFLEKSKDENKGQMPYFKGLSSSIMSYDEENRTWILKHLRYKDVIGYLADDSVDGTPIGRKSWIINDSSCPRDYANQSFSLTLTKCNESQFTCNDGSCLEDLGLRCDLKPDCLDQSDEFNCHRVVIDGKYLITQLALSVLDN